jgi:transposase
MKALTLNHPEITRQSLLAQADSIPGAWIGIRIATLLLFLSGWKSPALAQLFGVSRWAVCQWLGLANEQGLSSVQPRPAPGRKPRLSATVQQQLDLALQAAPEKFGLKRTRWDGVLVVEYLRRFHQVELKVRQAQRYVRRLGFTLQLPIYQYLQAQKKGVAQFQRAVKKNSARR